MVGDKLLTLRQLIDLLSGAGAGTIVYWFYESKWIKPWFSTLDSEIKRILAFISAGVVGVLAYLFGSLAMNYYPVPEPTFQAWAEAIVGIILTVGVTGAVTGQVWQLRNLRKSTLEKRAGKVV